MTFLRNLTISNRLWLIILVAILGFCALTFLALNRFHDNMMDEKRVQTKKLVESVHSIVSNYHERAKRGELEQEEAKQQAMASISVIRYDQNNYFWINDFNARILMHPIKKELNNTDASHMSDPNGKLIFSEFAKTARNQGAGFVSYQWAKTSGGKPVDKLSYVKAFEPWEWVIGTGIYTDDVEKYFWQSTISLGAAALLILALLLGLSLSITHSIVKPLAQTIAALDDISMGEGDLTKRLGEHGKDEISKLSASFNLFSEKILQMILQIAHVSTQLSTAADELSITSSQTHDNITQQQTETHQVATASVPYQMS
jgi:methyl-accepting chemotaxis protein